MSNLPPGCSVSDIPGNRPEDLAWEEFMEWVWDEIVESGLLIQEARMAIKMGISAMEAARPEINEALREARSQERFDMMYNQRGGDD